jgi:sugar lactone lactonase YvrE
MLSIASHLFMHVAPLLISKQQQQQQQPQVWFTDATHDALFKVPLTGQAMTLPTRVVAGCINASAVTIPKGQDYAYMACLGFRGNITGASPSGRRTSIVRINLDGTGLEVVADSLGHITAMSASDDYIYFCEKSGDVKYVDLMGSGLQIVAQSFDHPSGLVMTAKAFLEVPVLYVSDKTAIWRVAADGSSSTKIVKDLWNCQGLALDLSHGRLLWADKDANYIYSSDLDGASISEEVPIKNAMGVSFYTSTASMATKKPSHSPSLLPSPVPTKYPEPTVSPTPQPSLQPTLSPTYYEGQLFVSAGSTKSGQNLFAADADDVSSPTALTSGYSGVKGVAWSRSPPRVFWIDEDSGTIKTTSMESANYGSPDTIYTSSSSSSDSMYDLAVDEDWIYVSGDSSDSSVIRMAHDGTSVTTIVTGIASVTGIAVKTYYANTKVYFTSTDEDAVYSAGVDGGDLITVLDGLSTPNDVVYDGDYDKLYIACATEVCSLNIS